MATPLYSASFLNSYINSCIRFNPTLGFFLKGHGLQIMWHLTDVLFHFHCWFKTIETRNVEITAHSLDLKQCLGRRVNNATFEFQLILPSYVLQDLCPPFHPVCDFHKWVKCLVRFDFLIIHFGISKKKEKRNCLSRLSCLSCQDEAQRQSYYSLYMNYLCIYSLIVRLIHLLMDRYAVKDIT